MSEIRHIVSMKNSRTVQQENRSRKNVKNINHTKRGFNQINERSTGPHHTAIPKHSTDAWIPDNNQDPEKLRRVLRSKHRLPVT